MRGMMAFPAVLMLMVGCASIGPHDGARDVGSAERDLTDTTAADVAERIRRHGREALGDAMEALAEGVGGEKGRHTIMSAIIEGDLVYRFAHRAPARIDSEIVRDPRWKKPVGLRNEAVVINLLKAGLILRADPRVSVYDQAPFRMAATAFGTPSDASLLLARFLCWPGHSFRAKYCYYVFKYPGPGGDFTSWTALHHIAVAELEAKAANTHARRTGEIYCFLQDATGEKYAMSLRLHALAALRRYWPQKAARVDGKLLKGTFGDADIRELERLLVEDDPKGVQCEALAALRALGEAPGVKKRLEARAVREDSKKDERAKAKFALRLLGSTAGNVE